MPGWPGGGSRLPPVAGRSAGERAELVLREGASPSSRAAPRRRRAARRGLQLPERPLLSRQAHAMPGASRAARLRSGRPRHHDRPRPRLPETPRHRATICARLAAGATSTWRTSAYAEPSRATPSCWPASLSAHPGRARSSCSAASRRGKYVDVLARPLGDRLRFPAEFVGRGDMSRGGLMLRAADDGASSRTCPSPAPCVAGRARRGSRRPVGRLLIGPGVGHPRGPSGRFTPR